MIKTWIANAAVRKATIFSLVFVIAGSAIGVQFANSPDPWTAGDSSSMAVSHISMPHDNGPAARPEALATDEPLSLEALIQPLSVGAEQPDNILYRPEPEPEPETEPEPEPDPPETDAPEADPEERDPPEFEEDADFIYLPDIPLSRELQAYTWRRCREQELDYALVLAVMWRESRFETQAVNLNRNGTSDSGIMQINDVNKAWLHRELAIDDLFDPYQNIDAGTEMLGRFIRKHGERDALLAYQYGEAGMKRKLAQGITTSYHIRQIREKQVEFQAMLDTAAE